MEYEPVHFSTLQVLYKVTTRCGTARLLLLPHHNIPQQVFDLSANTHLAEMMVWRVIYRF